MPTKKTSTFSLKDQLFNRKKVIYLAGLISNAYPEFAHDQFVEDVVSQFPTLELKERIVHIREQLKKYLPDDYLQALTILLKSLPEPLDPTKTDDDFGDFIFAPLGDLVAAYGCKEEYLTQSLHALKEITKRFSAEDAIRFFVRKFPKETLAQIKIWTTDSNYHVRRLASEGTRPLLPWSGRVELDHEEIIRDVLTPLYADKTRYVVRSVANHLNDISKLNPDLVIKTVQSWQPKHHSSEFEYLKSHALRTLRKKGYEPALVLLGYDPNPKVIVEQFEVSPKKIKIGDSVQTCATISPMFSGQARIEYALYYQSARGKQSKKVYFIKEQSFTSGETYQFQKAHRFKPMTTRRLYPGEHEFALIVNGTEFAREMIVLSE
jgi:3-methyladenine DNA glycosylase AlkC